MKTLLLQLTLPFGAAQAAPVTIDFENTDDGNGGAFEVPQGFAVSGFFVLYVTEEGVFPERPAGTDGEALVMLGGAARPYADLVHLDSLPFGLESLDVYFDCEPLIYCLSDDWIVSAYDSNDDLISESSFSPDSYGWATLEFGSEWSGINRLRVAGWSGAEGSIAFVDNIVANVVPIPAAAWLFASGLGLLGWLKRRRGG